MPAPTAWPTTGDVATKLAALGITLRAGATSGYQSQVLNAVIDEVGRETRREFLKTAGQARAFDGSGTPEIEVDEFVSGSITLVRILGAIGSTQSLTLSNVEQVTDTLLPCTRIKLYRGTVPWITQVLVDRFPQGRENIEVTADWGYGATIPYDIWDAVCGEAAFRLAQEAAIDPGYDAGAGVHTGPFKRWAEGGEGGASEEYSTSGVEIVNGVWWTKAYARAIRNYRRPTGRHLRRLRSPMA